MVKEIIINGHKCKVEIGNQYCNLDLLALYNQNKEKKELSDIMQTGEYIIPRISAEEGHVLTNLKEGVEPKDVFFCGSILLGEGDAADNYTEITKAEMRAFVEAHPEVEHFIGFEEYKD